jgi:curved DNA-binding protein CbpA
MKRATYYSILGLNRSASKDEIKKSFRQLSLKYHPDRNATNENAHSIFIIINNAYSILTNEKTRKQYDAYLDQYENKAYAKPQYSREYDPLVRNALSELNYVFWDLEDLLKKLADELFAQKTNEMDLYEYLLHLLKYLEEELLHENYWFKSISNKQDRAKLHIENYYYHLRLEIEKQIKNMGQEIRNGTTRFKKLLDAKNKLIECIGEIGKYL